MQRIRQRLDATIWTTNLIVFAVAVFLAQFGQGLVASVRMNFFVDTIGLSSGQVLWLEGIRELPGLVLIFLAALTMRLPLPYQAALSVLLMGVGYGLEAFVGSYSPLLVMAIIASFGFHLWTPLNSAIGLSLSTKENAGRVLGLLSSVTSLAAIAGMGAMALISGVFESLALNTYFLIAGGFIVLAAVLILRLPKRIGSTEAEPPRILVKRRYWLYYVLIFFSGARKLVLSSFVTLVLVQDFGLEVWHVSSLMLAGNVLMLLLSPYIGSLIDRLGEQVATPVGYGILAVCCIGYATISNLWVLVALWMIMKLATPLGLALSTYVYRSAPPEELTPTLSAGVTFDHISSVGMPFLASALLPIVDYSGVFLATAVLILISIPFARALQTRSAAAPQALPASSE
ncbi:MAG: MFS transporter [Anaerolineales bacterium]|nr:MFS transporter [Anaerolineales bacterium]